MYCLPKRHLCKRERLDLASSAEQLCASQKQFGRHEISICVPAYLHSGPSCKLIGCFVEILLGQIYFEIWDKYTLQFRQMYLSFVFLHIFYIPAHLASWSDVLLKSFWDKYIYKFETNTLCNLRQIYLAFVFLYIYIQSILQVDRIFCWNLQDLFSLRVLNAKVEMEPGPQDLARSNTEIRKISIMFFLLIFLRLYLQIFLKWMAKKWNVCSRA